MSRTFVDSSANRIEIVEPFAGIFLPGADFTVAAFVNVTNTSSDQRTVISQYVSAANKFQLRTQQGTAPRALEVNVNGTTLANSGAVIALSTWYMVGCRQTGVSNVVEVFVLTLDLVTQDIGTATGVNAWAGNAANLSIGNASPSGTATDEMAGSIAYVAHFERKLSNTDLQSYARNPCSVWAAYAADLTFALKLAGGSPEADTSGNGHTGTVLDSPGTGAMPPVACELPAVHVVAHHHRQVFGG